MPNEFLHDGISRLEQVSSSGLLIAEGKTKLFLDPLLLVDLLPLKKDMLHIAGPCLLRPAKRNRLVPSDSRFNTSGAAAPFPQTSPRWEFLKKFLVYTLNFNLWGRNYLEQQSFRSLLAAVSFS